MNRYLTKEEYEHLRQNPSQMARYLEEHALAYPATAKTELEIDQELDDALEWSRQQKQNRQIGDNQ
ncbi:MAG: hypothetical protein ACRCXZ_02465 [Patescibacteria group bacterium]